MQIKHNRARLQLCTRAIFIPPCTRQAEKAIRNECEVFQSPTTTQVQEALFCICVHLGLQTSFIAYLHTKLLYSVVQR